VGGGNCLTLYRTKIESSFSSIVFSTHELTQARDHINLNPVGFSSPVSAIKNKTRTRRTKNWSFVF